MTKAATAPTNATNERYGLTPSRRIVSTRQTTVQIELTMTARRDPTRRGLMSRPKLGSRWSCSSICRRMRCSSSESGMATPDRLPRAHLSTIPAPRQRRKGAGGLRLVRRVRPPLLGAAPHEPKPLVTDGARRADRGRPEPLADGVDRLFRETPVLLVLAGLRDQIVEGQLVRSGAEVARADAQQTDAGRRVDRDEERFDSGPDGMSRRHTCRDGDRPGDRFEAGEPQLQRQRASRSPGGAQSGGDRIGKADELA